MFLEGRVEGLWLSKLCISELLQLSLLHREVALTGPALQWPTRSLTGKHLLSQISPFLLQTPQHLELLIAEPSSSSFHTSRHISLELSICVINSNYSRLGYTDTQFFVSGKIEGALAIVAIICISHQKETVMKCRAAAILAYFPTRYCLAILLLGAASNAEIESHSFPAVPWVR